MESVWERAKANSDATFVSEDRADRVRREVERMANCSGVPPALQDEDGDYLGIHPYEERVIEQSQALLQIDQYASGCMTDAEHKPRPQQQYQEGAASAVRDIMAWSADTLYRPLLSQGLDQERLNEEERYILDEADPLAQAWDAATLKRKIETGDHIYSDDGEHVRTISPEPRNLIDDAFTVIREQPEINDTFRSAVGSLQRWLHDYDDRTTCGFHQ